MKLLMIFQIWIMKKYWPHYPLQLTEKVLQKLLWHHEASLDEDLSWRMVKS